MLTGLKNKINYHKFDRRAFDARHHMLIATSHLVSKQMGTKINRLGTNKHHPTGQICFNKINLLVTFEM